MTVDTILVDGTDLQTTARIIQVWGGVHTMAAQRGSGYTIPDRDGIVDDVDRPFDAGLLSLGIMVRGTSDMTGFNDALRTLRTLVKPGRKVTLTRRLSFTSGNEDHTASARCQPFVPEMLTPADGKLVLNFILLDGYWYGTALTPTIPATITVPGDAVTRKITLTLPGAGTLTNTTTGVTLVKSTSGSNTIVVRDKTTTGTLAGLSASGDALQSWFNLAPGSNVVTWSGSGTPTISYQPAYL